MDIVILPQHWISFVVIAIIIVSMIVFLAKKYMITYALILTNFVVFVITILFQSQVLGSTEYAGLGFRPIYLTPEYLPQAYTLFTSMFIHGGFLHIFGNMLVLFFVGTAFENRVGWKKFILIYIIGGICGTLAHSFLNLEYPANWTTLIGASGAIFAIMGGFAYSYPHDKVVMPIPIGFFMILRRIKVLYAVLLFAVLETVIVIIGVQDQTAHFAHLGGLIGGLVVAALILRGRRTHTKKGDTIYYDSYMANRPRNYDFKSLEQFATTQDLKDMLEKIKNENVPQVKDIWMDHFLEKAVCPKCKSKLKHFNGKVWCDKCGFKTKY